MIREVSDRDISTPPGEPGQTASETMRGAGAKYRGIVLAGVHAWGDCVLERAVCRPLLPVADRPLVAHALDWVRSAGVAEATVCVLLEADVSDGIFLPGKVADYVGARRPMLAVSPAEGTMRDLMQACGGGEVADVRDAGAVTASLRRLYRSWKAGTLALDYPTGTLEHALSEDRVRDLYSALVARIIGE